MSEEGLAQQNTKARNFQSLPTLTLKEMKEVFDKHLIIADDFILDILVGLVVTHNLKCDPVWALFVAPSSGGKSELLNALLDLPNIFPISTITPKTFSSGFQGGKHALLNKLKNEILMFKDFTSILSLPLNEQGEIMSQLREIYDGKFDKTDGTGHRLRWEGKLGFLAGVTEIIDVRRGNLNLLGERFIQYRIEQPDRDAVVKKAINNTSKASEMRKELQEAMAGCVRGYLDDLKEDEDKGDIKEFIDFLARYTNFATVARTEVIRDTKSAAREIIFCPTPEMPTRFATSLWNLTRGLKIIGLEQEKIERIIKKICFDSIPKVKKLLIEYCADNQQLESDGRISNVDLSRLTGYARITIERNMEDLAVLGIMKKTKQTVKDNSPIMWHLQNAWRPLFNLEEMGDNVDSLVAGIGYGQGSSDDDPEF